MQIIANEQELDAFVTHAVTHGVVACDTEFVRVRTYYPELALIQIATDSRVVLIDPLEIKDFGSLKTLFENPDIVKVFHAPRQDIELPRHALGIKPKNIFDTQMAAAFLGLPDQVGYEALVREILEVQLDKSAQFTDWLQRPLSEEQLHYAAADVTYLLQIYKNLQYTLGERMEWAETISAAYDVDSLYNSDLTPLYLKWVPRLKKEEHKIRLWIGMHWREERAKKINRPRAWIVKDGDLLAFAREEEGTYPPGLMKELTKSTHNAKAAVKAALEGSDKPLNQKQKNDLKELKDKWTPLAEEHKIPLRFAASKHDLERYVRTRMKPEKASDWQNRLFWDTLDQE